MGSKLVFDQPRYDRLNAARSERVRELLQELQPRLGLRTAIDVGCGAGHFSGMLQSMGFEVTGVDGRRENVEESQRRHPGIVFKQMNAEDPALPQMGKFDLVFCFGLLYHLENPMLAIRNLHAMTKHLLLVEGLIYPGDEPIMGLVDEGHANDQGVNYFAFYPTEACLLKMFYRAGFAHAMRFRMQPNHPEYARGLGSRRARTMLAASPNPVRSALLETAMEPSATVRPWDAASGRTDIAARTVRFIANHLPKRLVQLRRRAIHTD